MGEGGRKREEERERGEEARDVNHTTVQCASPPSPFLSLLLTKHILPHTHTLVSPKHSTTTYLKVQLTPQQLTSMAEGETVNYQTRNLT